VSLVVSYEKGRTGDVNKRGGELLNQERSSFVPHINLTKPLDAFDFTCKKRDRDLPHMFACAPVQQSWGHSAGYIY